MKQATLRIALASHLLIPENDRVTYHTDSTVDVEVYFGEALVFFGNTVHAGRECKSICLRSFMSFTHSHFSSLDKQNYIRLVKPCDSHCRTCDGLIRYKEDHNGNLITFERHQSLVTGSSCCNGLTLNEFGFGIVSLSDHMKAVVGDGFCDAVDFLSTKPNPIKFQSIGQEITDFRKKGKKRLIMVQSGVKTAQSVLHEKFPVIHRYLQMSASTVCEYLKGETGLQYNLVDFTLLKNGDDGSGDQYMHIDDKSVCNCNEIV